MDARFGWSDLGDLVDPFKKVIVGEVTKVLPSVFSFFRAEAQARGGSRSPMEVEADADRSIAEFLRLLNPVIDQLIPFLIETFVEEDRARSSRGEPQELDRETHDRFWGAIAGAAIPYVVDNLPTIIDEVDTAFSSGGIFGSGGFFDGLFRSDMTQKLDVEQIPIPVADTSRIMNFWQPFMNCFGPALTNSIPLLFDTIWGKQTGRPRDYTMAWEDLSITRRLWDNDNVGVIGVAPAADPDNIEVVLHAAPHIRWWKGVAFLDDNGNQIMEVGVQDDTKEAEMALQADVVLGGGYLLLLKAKAFGIHTGMYRVSLARREELRGQRVHLLWAAD